MKFARIFDRNNVVFNNSQGMRFTQDMYRVVRKELIGDRVKWNWNGSTDGGMEKLTLFFLHIT